MKLRQISTDHVVHTWPSLTFLKSAIALRALARSRAGTIALAPAWVKTPDAFEAEAGIAAGDEDRLAGEVMVLDHILGGRGGAEIGIDRGSAARTWENLLGLERNAFKGREFRPGNQIVLGVASPRVQRLDRVSSQPDLWKRQ